ncbi:hypothetical protein FUAX_45410 (plasmid) [Fulvitalea axinellae]|uniref:N-acyl amino acid synthase FeeM catalytic core domain-containing protein n=1 Tax=Fulvitalea axinellae TaxID=1182444 RepID=A0AAU9DCA4_9BACT|nr:hypothetical protein FUAX_45410 [Fulvitalea axinellae]
MIIKPIKSESEFLEYGRTRFYNNPNNDVTGFIQNNISKLRREHEFDAYDLDSFHVGAFSEGKLHACTRMVNDTLGREVYCLDHSSRKIIESLSQVKEPENGLALQDYVGGKNFDIVEDFLGSVRADDKKFNEISRLIRNEQKGDKYLIKYLICYSWAFSRFYGFDFCFFEAVKSHCAYYERFFRCKRVLQEVEFTPITNGEPYYLMQAAIGDLPEKMDKIVNRIVEKFIIAGGPCAVKLDEIK